LSDNIDDETSMNNIYTQGDDYNASSIWPLFKIINRWIFVNIIFDFI
jgi:hypothetical protein